MLARWGSAFAVALALFVAATVGGIAAQEDAQSAFTAITEGKWGALVSALMGFVFVLLVLPEIRGWWDDRTHRSEEPRGEGLLNLSVRPVTNFGSIHTQDGAGHAWFFSDEIVIANHTKNRMLIKPSLRVGLKPTSNYGAPLELSPYQGALPPNISFGNDVPLLPRLISIEGRDYVSGRLAFRLHRGDVQQRFDGNLNSHMSGVVQSRYFDVFSGHQRVGGWGSRLRRL